MAIITLTTDFGLQDWFVGAMKGVLLRLAPRATLVDITHDIAPGDVRAGAFAVRNVYQLFPRGTVHLVVVDPGVGSERFPLALRSQSHFFVGPDNGVLSLAAQKSKRLIVHRLANPRYALPNPSCSFHGRDIFAPAAAYLAKGLNIARLGPRLKSIQTLPWPEPKLHPPFQGEIVYVDRFGNAITNLPNRLLDQGVTCLRVGKGQSSARAMPVGSHYQAVPRGHALAVAGSTGTIELAIHGGDAARTLGLRVGTRVEALVR